MDWHGTCAALALRLPISCRSCSATASDKELCAWPNVRVESEFTWKAMLVLDALQRTKICNDLHLMQDPQMPPKSPKCQALKCSACVSASLSFRYCIWQTTRAHCPTKMQVKGSQSHCHRRRHHYHHQPQHRSPSLSAFEFCSTEARTSKDCSLRLSISCRCCSAVAAVEALWASQGHR